MEEMVWRQSYCVFVFWKKCFIKILKLLQLQPVPRACKFFHIDFGKYGCLMSENGNIKGKKKLSKLYGLQLLFLFKQ